VNLQQLEYIVAVDKWRHFARAAEACHVTQPTLSMMIRRLEEELDTLIFDRSRQPVVPTTLGEAIIHQARVMLREQEHLLDLVQQARGKVQGSLKVGIIPTLAPYLVPLFIQPFTQKYPSVHLSLIDLRTEVITEQLKRGELDVGILVTPLNEGGIEEQPLFYEELFAYTSGHEPKSYLLPEDIDPKQLWLLEEGHCFRSQIMNLCALRKRAQGKFAYEAGSMETLKRLVDQQQGLTILPELFTMELSKQEKNRLRPFAPPAPVREVSLVVHRPGLKQRLIQALAQVILAVIPSHLRQGQAPTTRVLEV
jgi:LysR family transcriptional regulator, hydrogen peroxide-inducible genes activator